MASHFPIKRVFLAAVTVVGAAIAGFAMFQAWQYLYPPVAVLGVTVSGCDLHRSACMSSFPGGGRVTLGIIPRPIPLIAPIKLDVQVSGIDATYAEVEFTSPDMNMGFNRNTLAPAAAGSFSGTAVLPVCTLARMNWLATVRLHTARGTLAAVFEFATSSSSVRTGS
jgi:hypothetical protein